MKKIMLIAGCVLLGVGMSYSVMAKTITNNGIVSEVYTYDEMSADTTKNSNTVTDCSSYAGAYNRHGTIVRRFSVEKNGGASGTKHLDMPLGTDNIPDNSIIFEGFVDVIKPCLTASGVSSNSLTLNSAGDILAISTNIFSSTGIKAIIPVGTAATAVKATDARSLNYTIDGAITQGVFEVYLDYYYGVE